MRPSLVLVLITGLSVVTGCSRGTAVDIRNNDSAALVDALRQANARPGPDTIRLARNGLYILSQQAQDGLMLPVITGELTIEGNHAEIRGYTSTPSALLEIGPGAEVGVHDLVLAEGTDGALRNYGQLTLENVGIFDNSVDTMPAIVLNHGHLVAVRSEIAYNLLLATRRDAGTVLNYGEIELEGSLIHDNRALGRQPTVAVSGGILNFGSVKADGLQLADNEIPSEDSPRLSFGGILNLGNGRVMGSAPADAVRNVDPAQILAGF